MSAFTQHQRDLLRYRIERAIVWSQAEGYKVTAARHTAEVIVAELELSGLSAAAQRRAVDKVIVNLEERSA